jgi:hypothetical protein
VAIPISGKLARNSDAGEVSKAIIERAEKVFPSDSELEPVAVEYIAKIANVMKGPKIFGMYAASISC